MHELEPSALRMLAQDISRAHAAVDSALIHMSRLTANMLELGAQSRISAADGQKAIEAVTEGISTFVTGRARMVRAHRHMATIKGQSNLKATDMGCLPGPLTTGQLSAVA